MTSQFLTRFAYAKTLGRPDYADIIPNADINENDNDPNQPGTINVRNTGLRPWSADNFDLSFEYYPVRGGVLQVGAFLKELQDFWGVVNGPLTPTLITEPNARKPVNAPETVSAPVPVVVVLSATRSAAM